MMSAIEINRDLLKQFEQGLDPQHPENGVIPARVLGYGEISTTLEIGSGSEQDLAYKRVPMFLNELEAERYEAIYREYIQGLKDRVGIPMISSDMTRVYDDVHRRLVVYIVQRKIPAEAVCHRAIHHFSPEDVARLVRALLSETARVFEFNQQNKGRLEFGFDGQISNWAIVNYDPDSVKLPDKIELEYFDTSTPLMRVEGKEQLDPELFLRSAPSFLVWILRLLFLEDVMTRYYDLHKVCVDLVANFYKEQRPELIPAMVDAVNQFFSTQIQAGSFKALSQEEVRSYYQEDAWIWRLYLAFRKFDRTIHHLLGRYYPYILAEKIKR